MIKRYIPIFLSIVLVVLYFIVVKNLKDNGKNIEKKTDNPIGLFEKEVTKTRYPDFLSKFIRLRQPMMIDLSQQHYKGLAFYFGKNHAIHLKSWEIFDYFGAYDLDKFGNIYLTPMPFISIKPTTFNLQKNIYILDGKTAKISIWKTIDEVEPTPNNPFGIISVEYDDDDNSLWISSIDKSDYNHQRGRIYHIDIESKSIIQEIKDIDALSLKLIHTTKGKYLLFGSARENILYGLLIEKQKIVSNPIKILSIPDNHQRIRKIIIRKKNRLLLKTIPFSYSLIAQTTEGSIRTNYNIFFYKSNIKVKMDGEI